VVGEDDIRPALAAVDGEASVLALELSVVHGLSADEVGHGRSAVRAEGVLGGLGRLEEHVGVAVAVQEASSLASAADEVAILGVDGGDVLDRGSPVVLRLQHLSLSHRGDRGGVRHGRVVQVDADLAVVVALVAEGVLDGDLVLGGRVGEDVRAHGGGGGTVVVDLVVGEDDIRPALAAVDGEASVLALELSVVHGLSADEVGHGRSAVRAEGVLGGLGRLEEHVGVAVAVQEASSLASAADEVAILGVDGGDVLDRGSPVVLRLQHLSLSHRSRANRVRHGRVVQVDADLAVLAALVAEGVLDLGHVTSGRAREDVRAHGGGGGAVERDLVVVERDALPALAAVDRKAGILVVAVVDDRAANKVRHGLAASRAEGHLGGLGRLEEDLGVAVAVQLGGGVARRADVVALVSVGGGDGLDRISPSSLGREDLLLGHWHLRQALRAEVEREALLVGTLVGHVEKRARTVEDLKSLRVAEADRLEHGRGEGADGAHRRASRGVNNSRLGGSLLVLLAEAEEHGRRGSTRLHGGEADGGARGVADQAEGSNSRENHGRYRGCRERAPRKLRRRRR